MLKIRELLVDAVREAVHHAGMCDVSSDAVERLLLAMDDEDNEDDDDVRASFAYELAKDKIDDYERKANKIFDIVMGGRLELLMEEIIINNYNLEQLQAWHQAREQRRDRHEEHESEMAKAKCELKAPPPVTGSDPALDKQDLSEVVMATTVGWTKKAARRKAGNLVVQKTGVQLSSETLGKALSQMKRLPKPRSCEAVDDIVWADARATAEKEMVEELKIQMQCEDYYLKMCSVGQFLFAKEVHTKTQRIYDYRAIKLFKKQERSNVTTQ